MDNKRIDEDEEITEIFEIFMIGVTTRNIIMIIDGLRDYKKENNLTLEKMKEECRRNKDGIINYIMIKESMK